MLSLFCPPTMSTSAGKKNTKFSAIRAIGIFNAESLVILFLVSEFALLYVKMCKTVIYGCTFAYLCSWIANQSGICAVGDVNQSCDLTVKKISFFSLALNSCHIWF